MNLDDKAAELGIMIHETDLLHADLNATYIHTERTIIIRSVLAPYTRRAALAHELGHAVHAVHGDEHSDDSRPERRADDWAAQGIISGPAYREAEQGYGPHPGALAWSPGVTRDVVDTWLALTVKRLMK